MIIWQLGDSALDAQPLATALGAELINSSAPDVIFEDVWITQVHDLVLRPYLYAKPVPEIVVVVYVNNNDYDSEGTIARILNRSAWITKVLYLYPENPSFNLLDGFTHFSSVPIQHGVIGATTLEAMYES